MSVPRILEVEQLDFFGNLRVSESASGAFNLIEILPVPETVSHPIHGATW